MNLAIFASGSGTNAENIYWYFAKKATADVVLIVTNRENAKVIERAKKLHIAYEIVPKNEWKNQQHILQLLKNHKIDFIILAGFLLKIPPYLIKAYPNKIINIHPALLPKYGGKGMYGDNVHKALLDNGEKETGISIHYVNEKYDEGAIIFQAKCPVLPDDNTESIAKKVHQLEYKYYPAIIEKLVQSAKKTI